MNKSYIILCLYDRLLNGECIGLKSVREEFDLSVPTFRRHIAFLRDYLLEQKKLIMEFDKKVGAYRIIGELTEPSVDEQIEPNAGETREVK
ncbi:MAG: hypothetical protein IJU84_01715 [Clostridia bacterium]|nr:hypothetical protein [Clostridia bacterium]